MADCLISFFIWYCKQLNTLVVEKLRMQKNRMEEQ